MNVINLIGPPGAGKSTTAARLFADLKQRGVVAELVTEYAKDLTWERAHDRLSYPPIVTSEQAWRIARLRDKKVEVVVTDGPVLLGLLYGADMPACWKDWVLFEHGRYRSLTCLIERVKPYVPVGRSQTEAESDAIADRLLRMLIDERIRFKRVRGDEAAASIIMHHAMTLLETTRPSTT